VEVETRVLWQEKDAMVKLALPTPWKRGTLLGQVAYGAQEFPATGEEGAAQKWLAVSDSKGDRTFSIINDTTYGFDMKDGVLRLSLLRGPAHAGHPTASNSAILPQDRFTPRLDQGEHTFRFWINGGPRAERLRSVDREAMAHNEGPYALSYWPPGGGVSPAGGPRLSDHAVQIVAFKKAEDGDDLIVRLFEPTGRRRKTTLALPATDTEALVELHPFEIKTLRVSRHTGRVREVDLLER
jgi:alpha-mannosidase